MTLEEMLQWQLEVTGVERYHKAGYKGKGIRVLCHEDSEHGGKAMQVLQQIAPEVEVIFADVSQKLNGNKLLQYDWNINGIAYTFDEVMNIFKPDIISCSLKSNIKCPEREAIIQPYIDSGELIMVTCTGNEGTDGVFTMYDNGLTIGAVQFFNKKTDIRVIGYSGRTKEALAVDYVGFMWDWGGTSASTPFVAGQIALFISRFGKMSQSKFQEIIKPYCMDLGDRDKDWIYGDGLIILPESIEIEKEINETNDIEEREEINMAFNDVENNRWSKSSIDWASRNKIVTGFEDGTFKPEEPLTREQMCVILQRYHEKKDIIM